MGFFVKHYKLASKEYGLYKFSLRPNIDNSKLDCFVEDSLDELKEEYERDIEALKINFAEKLRSMNHRHRQRISDLNGDDDIEVHQELTISLCDDESDEDYMSG